MEQARLGYQRNFEPLSVSPFRHAIEALQPGATGSQIAALLDHRISRQVASHWYAGRRGAPRWALETLAAKLRARAAEQLAVASMILNAPDRPGLKAGARNLAVYLANKNR